MKARANLLPLVFGAVGSAGVLNFQAVMNHYLKPYSLKLIRLDTSQPCSSTSVYKIIVLDLAPPTKWKHPAPPPVLQQTTLSKKQAARTTLTKRKEDI